MRVGNGFDVHRLVVGRRLVLGGVEVPFGKGLLGHSDGDALAHALIDALLGAAALGDIGTQFPSTDPQYKDIDSLVLLRRVAQLLAERGWKVSNVDATILAEQPRLGPHVSQMRERLARDLGLTLERVSVKAKTADGLGPVGQGECIAAYAVACLEEPE
ncbi:MAG: 2-C-methyl-D-erythritol 2,4-cyclodiphosphate synthase [Chloroflexi bacterium]|nr:2-C-methyl-D-erythritol 2,4-cyclodiphosphate synthase [Chloroflexota bacterium]